ncbi:MAG: hypothetical protein WCJ29_03850 [bacterium]
MRRIDRLYGPIEIPDSVQELETTSLARRMRNISMSAIPHEIEAHGSMPSRAEHGLGTMHLIMKGISSGKAIYAHEKALLPIAGYLHDAGNPPFSHMSERFMSKRFGYDGESFLEVLLEKDLEAKKIIEKNGLTISEVVDCVTGKTRHSWILNGIIDTDNMDNVGRYGKCAGLVLPEFSPQHLARSMYFMANEWLLDTDETHLIPLWQQARFMVYKKVYELESFARHAMLYRTLELAEKHGLLTREFFELHDATATEYLLRSDDRDVSDLMRETVNHIWFDCSFALETQKPSERLQKLIAIPEIRTKVADELAERFVVPPNHVAVHIGKGRDFRGGRIPTINMQEHLRLEYVAKDEPPIYRVRVFANRHMEGSKKRIAEIMETMIDHKNQLPQD